MVGAVTVGAVVLWAGALVVLWVTVTWVLWGVGVSARVGGAAGGRTADVVGVGRYGCDSLAGVAGSAPGRVWGVCGLET